MSKRQSKYLAIILISLCVLLQLAIHKGLLNSSPFEAISGVFFGFGIASSINIFRIKK